MDISLNSETVQYNVEYECQYKNKKSECDDDLEEMYQQDIIHIFGLDDFNYEKMIIEIEKIYNLLVKYDVTELLECSKILAARYMTQDPVIGLIFLFSYDYLYLFHACLCVFLNSPLDFTKSCKYYIQLKMELEKR